MAGAEDSWIANALLFSLANPLFCSPPPTSFSLFSSRTSYKTVDEFLHDVRRLCANSFLYSRETRNEVLRSFLRKLDTDEVKKILTPSKPLVPKWEKCLAVSRTSDTSFFRLVDLTSIVDAHGVRDEESQP